MSTNNHTKLSTDLHRYFFEEERQPEVKAGDILALAGERVFGFLFVILALPSALPIPAPGYSIPFGILMFLLAIQLIAGAKRPWLPPRMLNYSLKLEQAQRIIKAGMPWLKRIEAVTKPRLTYICRSLPGRVLMGCAIALMSISMMIPIPGTNTLPAMGIFVTGFGLQEDDGAISLGGLIICCGAIIVVAGIFFFGISFLNIVKDWIVSLL
ncbi:MAG: exopolysaccharide biosynthesis protein [Gammaproteobacteria bacterium]|nr:exopolysaccharide biosynthesis protein [Gammaproteobacteria bacterium]